MDRKKEIGLCGNFFGAATCCDGLQSSLHLKSRLLDFVKKGGTAWCLQTVQLQLVVERLAVYAQQLGRFAFVAAGGLQGL